MKLLICIVFPFVLMMNEFSGPSGNFQRSESAPADTLIQMERTVCFGTCPSYVLAINGNGNVVFEGREFVAHKGTAEGEISKEKLDKLLELIDEINFMQIPSDPKCDSRMTDHPSVFLTIEIGEQQNSITHYQGCKGFEHEEELYKLESAIDSLSNANQWIGEE